MSEDRLTTLLTQTTLNYTGIDFVRVVDPEDQRVLHVYFVVDPESLVDPFSSSPVSAESIGIVSVSGGESLAEAAVESVANVEGDAGRNVLEITVHEPGDFSRYRLTIDDSRIDRFFKSVEFSFKQGCPSDFDCQEEAAECPPGGDPDFAVDYLARDFESIRAALLEYSAQQYPNWREPVAADTGYMMAEVLSALGDELSYIQDRYAAEAYLETATERRSLRRLARLVDYTIHDGLAAHTFLDLTVQPAAGGIFVSAGNRVWAPVVDGIEPLTFEIGERLSDQRAGAGGGPKTFWVHPNWNEIAIYMPDSAEPGAEIGATEIYLDGAYPSSDVPSGEDPAQFWIGRQVLLRSDPSDPAVPARRHLVSITEVETMVDPLAEGGARDITRISWAEEDALPFELPLAETRLRGNIVPAVSGETYEELFTIGSVPTAPSEATRAVERQGPFDSDRQEGSITYLYSLQATADRGLAYVQAQGVEADDPDGEIADPTPEAELRTAEPEVELQEVDPSSGAEYATPEFWTWQRTLLDATSQSKDYGLDDGTWRSVIGFRSDGERIEHVDYASQQGVTVRFGSPGFGQIPKEGTVFKLRYRTSGGSRANLPQDTITLLTHPSSGATDLSGVLDAVNNPFSITTGVDPESSDDVKMLAPEAFRSVTFRAVREEDFEEIARRLSYVQKAGASFRWTGSWLSAFVTPDPAGSYELSDKRRDYLEQLMDRVRQAGREVLVKDPGFVSLDLEVCICVEPSAYEGQVKEAVVQALTGKPVSTGARGFFDPDAFTFGSPLYRSALEAAIQSVPGVLAVNHMAIRARGVTDKRPFEEMVFEVGANQIIRLENDPLYPERGSLRIHVGVSDGCGCGASCGGSS